jgi:hypothetical protein
MVATTETNGLSKALKELVSSAVRHGEACARNELASQEHANGFVHDDLSSLDREQSESYESLFAAIGRVRELTGADFA